MTLTDHDGEAEGRRSDDDQFVRFPCRFDKSTVTSRSTYRVGKDVGGERGRVRKYRHFYKTSAGPEEKEQLAARLIGVKRQSRYVVAFDGSIRFPVTVSR